ncbi:MAG: hypothetical protein A2V65_07735 [Deltaproteobacteria bacterium RBG_13_49_15]|nr:MAG: hypothetical protein A2V65_07735 [Deltaproteobacteria bacterium RBG_13_49_15]
MNQKSWEKFNKNQQAIIEEGANAVIEKQLKEGKERDEMYRKKATDAVIKYVALSPKEYSDAIKTVRNEVWPKMAVLIIRSAPPSLYYWLSLALAIRLRLTPNSAA